MIRVPKSGNRHTDTHTHRHTRWLFILDFFLFILFYFILLYSILFYFFLFILFHFGPNIFLRPKSILTQRNMVLISFGPKIFWTQNYFEPKKDFFYPNFFWTYYFLAKHFIRPQNVFDHNFFGTIFFVLDLLPISSTWYNLTKFLLSIISICQFLSIFTSNTIMLFSIKLMLCLKIMFNKAWV